MHLSFQFNDFFRERNPDVTNTSDIKTPTFLVQSGVVGDLKIKDAQETLLRDTNANLEIKLEGFMRTELDTCIQSRSEFRVTCEKKILSMTQALSMEGHANNAANNERHYPFNFNVESWLRRDIEGSSLNKCLASRSNFVSLPPSLTHEILKTPQGVPKPRAGAHVTYRLTAHLSRNRKTIHRIMHPIYLLISQDPSPPTCMADFVGEYQMAQKCLLRGPLFQKAGQLSIDVQEPKQLTIKADCTESMVELPVKLTWERQKQEINVYQLPQIEAEVKWQFRLSTFVSILEQRGPPTLKQALASPATAFVRSNLPERSMNMTWRNWQPVANQGSSSRIESEQSLWLALPRSQILTPTFWSPFLSRRYSIWLQVRVTKPGAAKLEVEVPIQVGIEPTHSTRSVDSAGYDALFDEAEVDEILPQYVR